ncbi:hypothetical protein P3342_001018 [Pyrenophora teres f. teres]|uniref:Uncharacterized protein n=1 Tax=Pyrenophora teres f. teres TaxID=97479 RepID=A0A6S6VA20_9PLEO|nr:hypothetical protein P3342_001018 [Pyrenophora teres f. teres]CAE6999416.1 hypothetical protein PTTW11_00890 [Pyrenophora teres f. teres]
MAPLYPYQATVPASHPHNFQMHVPGVSVPPYDIAMNEFVQGFVLGALLWVAFLVALYSVKFCIWATTMILDGVRKHSGRWPCRCSICTRLYNQEMKEEIWSTGNEVDYDLFLMD